ncbi:MAG: hypothetical protein ACTSV6_05475 [Candidatus Heimdallarchaeota archaeon]
MAISVNTLLKKVYEKIIKQVDGKEISFDEPVETLIADDSDWHRTARGYMQYTSGFLVKIKDALWFIARGRPTGSYPARPYDSDIITIKLTSSSVEDIKKEIQKSWYFLNSILWARKDGRLGTARNEAIGNQVKKRLTAETIQKFKAKNLEYDQRYVTVEGWSIKPVVKSPILYKKEFADYLAKIIIEILSELSVGDNAEA